MDEEMLMAMVEGGGEQREKQLLEADFFKVRGKKGAPGVCTDARLARRLETTLTTTSVERSGK